MNIVLGIITTYNTYERQFNINDNLINNVAYTSFEYTIRDNCSKYTQRMHVKSIFSYAKSKYMLVITKNETFKL